MSDRASPTLDAEALRELAPFGQERAVDVGDVLFRAGDESYDFLVVLEGAVDIVRPDVEGETLITTHGAGRFLGELNMLTGQGTVALSPSTAVWIPTRCQMGDSVGPQSVDSFGSHTRPTPRRGTRRVRFALTQQCP